MKTQLEKELVQVEEWIEKSGNDYFLLYGYIRRRDEIKQRLNKLTNKDQ